MKCSYHQIYLDGKSTKSNPFHFKNARKRLYFNYFKERLFHFNGTVVKEYNRKIYEKLLAKNPALNELVVGMGLTPEIE